MVPERGVAASDDKNNIKNNNLFHFPDKWRASAAPCGQASQSIGIVYSFQAISLNGRTVAVKTAPAGGVPHNLKKKV
jgi:hypothetical protein